MQGVGETRQAKQLTAPGMVNDQYVWAVIIIIIIMSLLLDVQLLIRARHTVRTE